MNKFNFKKDLKVQQQKVLIQEKVDDKIRSSKDGKQGSQNVHHTGKGNKVKCYFCDETEDHVATNGPRATQIVQYFACKKFAGLVRKVVVKYRSNNENVDWFTTWAMREPVIIHPIDKVHLMEELAKMSTTNLYTLFYI